MHYIIVQAGGKGSRLKEMTINKPKAIVSINNLPMIFYLFKKYPKSKFIIIGDYKKDVLDRYLQTFAEVDFITVGTDNNTGTCSGISNALKLVPYNQSFILVWSDLILGESLVIPDDGKNYVGISGNFECRWSWKEGSFIESKSSYYGVAGLFVFNNKKLIENVPDSGEFVRWLQYTHIEFYPLQLLDTAEFGLREKVNEPQSGKCRPFNRIKITEGKITKEGVDSQGQALAIREKAWYKHVFHLNVPIPMIYSFEPLTMEYIDGRNAFDYNLSYEQKKNILSKIIAGLKSLHLNDSCFFNAFDMKQAYFDKTIDRLNKVRDLIPFTNEKFIFVNGKKCRNIFFHLDQFRNRVYQLNCKEFCLIHGDCTFSNIILKHGVDPYLIDPRGYFGSSELVGDPNYDWSKLYYSIVGNYDQFNLGRFSLKFINSDLPSISLEICSNGWEELEKDFFEMLPQDTSNNDIKFIHAIIWLSLTTYAWNDYDSICGAFYNGLYYLEDYL